MRIFGFSAKGKGLFKEREARGSPSFEHGDFLALLFAGVLTFLPVLLMVVGGFGLLMLLFFHG